ncbi:MAG: cytochrome D1 domain-containing protein [Candidatus Acidiferrales bacterium]|jgi:YVTN family beta-propeller protein
MLKRDVFLRSIAGLGIAVLGTAGWSAAANKARILQTNFAGDNITIIDPATNKVIGSIPGIEVNHGVGVAPDGMRIYVSSEADSTLDIVDSTTFEVINRIALSGHPNNIAVSPDGRKVYVAIIGAKGGVDVIDTASQKNVKNIVTGTQVHNPYVTPDGKFVLAGSHIDKKLSVIDAQTEELAWTLPMDLGVRPIAISTNPDGSTKWLFLQLTNFNGFAVLDFATRKEINRITLPDVTPGKKIVPGGGEVSHGIALTKDQKTLLVSSRRNSALYFYSVPDFALIGSTDLSGKGAAWLSLSPDGKTAYVSNSMSNTVSAIDIASMKEVALIPVGYVPKRNVAAMLPR